MSPHWSTRAAGARLVATLRATTLCASTLCVATFCAAAFCAMALCGCSEAPSPAGPLRPSAEAAPTHPTPTQHGAPTRRCPVGELCEASSPVDGWRLPKRCVFEHRGRWSTRCRLSRTPLAMARRFLLTRYRVVTDGTDAVVARPRGGGEGEGGPRIAARQVRADVIMTTAGRPEPLDIPRAVSVTR